MVLPDIRVKLAWAGPLATFGIAYFASALLGHFLSFPEASPIAAFWPASGLFLGTLALSARRKWAPFVAAAVAAEAVAAVARGSAPLAAAGICLAHVVEAVAGAWTLQWLAGGPFRIQRVRDVLILSAVGLVPGPVLSAAIGATVAVMAGAARPWLNGAYVWWMAHVVGTLLVAPVLLTFHGGKFCKWPAGILGWLESAAVACGILAASALAFGPLLAELRIAPYPFIVAPFLVWLGLRFDRFSTSCGALLAGLIAVWGTTRGYGLFPLVEKTLEMQAAGLQVYLMVIGVMPLLFAAVTQDHRAADARLQQNLELLRAVLDGTSDAIFVKDLQGRYLLINETGASMLGKSVAEIVGRDDAALFDEETARRIRDEDRRVILSAETTTIVAEATACGRTWHHHTTKGPYRDADGRVVGVVGISRDISEQKRAEEILRKSQQELEEAKTVLERRVAERTDDLLAANEQLRREMAERASAVARLHDQQAQLAHAARLSSLGEMAAELAHELNQPLSAISNYVRGTQRRLAAGSLSVDEIRPTLEIIGKESQRAAEVVLRTKNFVRKQPPTRVPLDLAELVSEALAMLAHECRERQVEIERRLPGDLPKVAGDAVQLQQVVVNLVLNALEALQAVPPENRRLTITAKRSDDFLRLGIADSGPGLEPAIAERIFEAFFSTRPEGLGLGLTISRSIIEGHGGRLWADSTPGEGTCFYFTLPIWEEQDDANVSGACADRICGGR